MPGRPRLPAVPLLTLVLVTTAAVAALSAQTVTAADGESPTTRPADLRRSTSMPEPPGADATRRAARDAVDEAELARRLLDGPGDGRPAPPGRTVGDLMAEAARRLTEDGDAGDGTQYVQEQILAGIDDLIRRLEAEPGWPNPRPAPAPTTQPGTTPAPATDRRPSSARDAKSAAGRDRTPGASPGGGDGPTSAAAAADLRQAASGWGRISPRLVGPMIEGQADRVCDEKYRGLVDDYYRAVATKASE